VNAEFMVDVYTPLGDLKSETFGSAGNSSVNYGYYPTSGFGSTGSPDAVSSITVNAAGGSSAVQSDSYDSFGRLQTITINGITLTYTYLANSDQLASIQATPGGAAGAEGNSVLTSFTPDAADGSRLGGITVETGAPTTASSTVPRTLTTPTISGRRTP
jgi:hypothetical protein